MTRLPAEVRGFHELLDILLQDGAAVILKAFFDASERTKGRIFCVAGFAFRKLQLQKFDRDWWQLFGKYGGCHMKELTRPSGRFEGISRAEANRLIKEAVAILRKRTLYGVAVSCHLDEIHAVLPRWIKEVSHAYPLCCHLAMTALGSKVSESGAADDVAYVFESGDAYSGIAHDFMKRTGDVPELKESYRHHSHTFVGKNSALALQAADLFAWEFAKFVDETMYQNVRDMRLSLAHLFARNRQYDWGTYKVLHVYGDSLRTFAKKTAELGLMQLREDAARKEAMNASSSAASSEPLS